MVYSFGGHLNAQFEEELHRIVPCEIYTFDPTSNATEGQVRKGLHFYRYGLGGGDFESEIGPLKTLASIMHMLNHTSIDILKIDIEGGERDAFEQLGRDGFPPIGQMQIEFHSEFFYDIMPIILNASFQIFHTEMNSMCDYCAEYAFIKYPVAKEIALRQPEFDPIFCPSIIEHMTVSASRLEYEAQFTSVIEEAGINYYQQINKPEGVFLGVFDSPDYLKDVNWFDGCAQGNFLFTESINCPRQAYVGDFLVCSPSHFGPGCTVYIFSSNSSKREDLLFTMEAEKRWRTECTIITSAVAQPQTNLLPSLLSIVYSGDLPPLLSLIHNYTAKQILIRYEYDPPGHRHDRIDFIKLNQFLKKKHYQLSAKSIFCPVVYLTYLRMI